jgi:MFS family permease
VFRSVRSMPGAEIMSRRHTAILAVLCGVLFLDGLDISLVGVALPSIKRELGLGDSQLQWIVSGYVLGYGGLLLLGGRTADLLGRRRTLLIALGVFALASLAGGVTSNGSLLIYARFLKGAAAAFTAPAGLSIITTSFEEGPQRNRALSLYGATGASGFSLGLVIGGLTTQVGWRLAFLLPAPIALALLIAGLRVLPPEVPRLHYAQRLDLPGAVTLTAAMLLLVRTVVEAPGNGWGSGATVGAFAVTVLLLGAFVVIERRSRSPLLRLGLLRSSALIRANLGIMTLFGAYVGFQFVLTLYLQAMNHWSPIRTALAFLPVGVLIAAGAVRIGPFVQRVGTERLIAAGFVGIVIGYGLLLRIAATPAWIAVLLPTTLLVGAGIGVAFPPLNIQAVSGIMAHEQGIAGAIFQASNQIGAAVVLAVVTAVVTSNGGASTERAVLLAAYRDGLFVVAAVAAAGLLIALSALVWRPVPAKMPA